MIKSTIILASLFACAGATLARADPIEGRAACVAQSADYLAQVKIDTPVETLVAKSREFYPDVIQLIEEEVPSNDYRDAMHELSSQLGCETITQHFLAMPQAVPCYETLDLEKGDTTTLDIVKSNEKAKDAFEAYFACITSV